MYQLKFIIYYKPEHFTFHAYNSKIDNNVLIGWYYFDDMISLGILDEKFALNFKDMKNSEKYPYILIYIIN